jgi:thymidine kinase
LQTIATEKNHLKATCNNCGKDAEYTYRKVDNKVLVLIGNANHYEARCESCYGKKD